jgi:hypothetical protein
MTASPLYPAGMAVDLFVVGGGIGALWGGPVGWAAFALVTATNQAMKLTDGALNATAAEADIMPFAAAIQWWHDTGHGILQPRVLCVTDSPEVVELGTNPYARDLRTDWRFIDWFERRGYQISWLWESRNDHAAVVSAAEQAREAFRERLRVPSPV